MDKKKIERINFLASKSKTEGLTDAEKEEQALLRREYIDSFKAGLRAQLNNTYVVDKQGNKSKLGKKKLM